MKITTSPTFKIVKLANNQILHLKIGIGIKTLATLLFLANFLSPQLSWADARQDRFRNSPKDKQYIAFGATHLSDHNSKEYKISSTYEYSGSKFIGEIDFLHHGKHSNTTTTPTRKTKELYDMELSGKALISQSSNYFNFYNRTKYDEFSDEYYDITNAAGWGRRFFDDIFEADLNIGYNDIKNYESHIVINPNLKASFWITDRLKFLTIIMRKLNQDYLIN